VAFLEWSGVGVRVLVLALLALVAAPAGASSFEDVYRWLFSGNERSASKHKEAEIELPAFESVSEPGLSTLFFAEALPSTLGNDLACPRFRSKSSSSQRS
jgi:hypothetical protein